MHLETGTSPGIFFSEGATPSFGLEGANQGKGT